MYGIELPSQFTCNRCLSGSWKTAEDNKHIEKSTLNQASLFPGCRGRQEAISLQTTISTDAESLTPVKIADLFKNNLCRCLGAVRTEARYALRYAGSRAFMRLQGLREPPGSCKLLKSLLLGLWHGGGHRFDPDQADR
jgi:hypothetical protein